MSQNLEINDYLVRSLLNLIIFIEFSGDDIIDPDAAVQAMEQLSARLLDMEKDKRALLVKNICALSTEYKGEKSEFIESIAENLGLV